MKKIVYGAAACLAVALAVGGPSAAAQPGEETASAPDAPPPFEAMAVLKAVGPVEIHAPGPIARRDVIASLPVAHSLTGVLGQDVRKMGLLAGGAVMPAGTPVFGVPMTDPYGSSIIWCAPKSEPRGETVAWTTICFPRGGMSGHQWVRTFAPLFPTSLSYTKSTSGAAGLTVDRKPADLPVMRLTFKFTEWDKDDADVMVSVEGPGAIAPIRNRSLPREADGSARLKIFGGEFRLIPVGGDRHAALLEVITPPSPTLKPEF
ncbi:hypothetical protein [Caulobacter endophyticus]|uniref:hypothetical protein n=1 Tax=Caulobacter endophyticus TaxID=2172652 RepID=UPI0024106E9F|nr:hypothetical protein [Caulobacter endophyticus]MDG2530808.1 hypothetical protein [Caulobacter endophyticus]